MCGKCTDDRITGDYSRVITVILAAVFGIICGLIIVAKFF